MWRTAYGGRIAKASLGQDAYAVSMVEVTTVCIIQTKAEGVINLSLSNGVQYSMTRREGGDYH